MNRALAPVVLLITLLAAGCGGPRPVEIQTEPSGAEIFVDGDAIGVSPVVYEFDFANADRSYKVKAKKEGFVPGEKKVTALRLDMALEKQGGSGKEVLSLVIDEDESWTQTSTSPLANAWYEIDVNPELDKKQVWELLVDVVTKYYPELTNLDDEAGYIAAKEKESRFRRGATSTVLVRNQFFCSLATRTPLVYKIKIESQINENGKWVPLDRIFKKDVPLSTDLEARLVVQD